MLMGDGTKCTTLSNFFLSACSNETSLILLICSSAPLSAELLSAESVYRSTPTRSNDPGAVDDRPSSKPILNLTPFEQNPKQ